ncbi:MAG: hypothetical protein ACTSQI_11960 [Candidatus Helarchaeota archaeon]
MSKILETNIAIEFLRGKSKKITEKINKLIETGFVRIWIKKDCEYLNLT